MTRLTRTCGTLALAAVLTACSQSGPPDAQGTQTAEPTYRYDWESLRQAPVPEWLQDAKFGIFIHWGPYSVPGWSDGRSYSEWYSSLMYWNESFVEHHRRNYGEPGEFGYKDFIPMFEAELFDPDEWAGLFEASGAGFVIPTGEHHDGFAMWDSDLTDWNAVDMGPRFDFIGRLSEAVRRQGLRFGVSYHRERHWGFYTDSVNTYAEHPQPRPALAAELEAHPEAIGLYGPFGLSEAFMQDYKARFLEIVDKYQPDFMWIDDAPSNSLHPEAPAVDRFMNKYQMEMLTDYLNKAEAWGRPVYFNNKKWQRSNYPAGIGVDDKDYLRLEEISPRTWLSTGGMAHSYGYDRTEEAGNKYRSVETLLEILVDVVSKNGCFLLDVGPRADGTIPEAQKQRLLGIGEWLGRYGEAVYGTRPWTSFGFDEVRFTRRGDALYAMLLDWPEKGRLTLTSTESIDPATIERVQLLGSEANVDWQAGPGGLELVLPDKPFDDHVYVVRIDTSGL